MYQWLLALLLVGLVLLHGGVVRCQTSGWAAVDLDHNSAAAHLAHGPPSPKTRRSMTGKREFKRHECGRSQALAKAGRYYIQSTEYIWSTYRIALLLSGSKNQPRLCDSVQLGSGTPCRPRRRASCMRPGRLYYTEYRVQHRCLADVCHGIASSAMQHSKQGWE